MTLAVIDYGMGNLGSVRRAIGALGGDVALASRPAELASADRIILPGVGSFSEGMRRLREGGWDRALADAVHERGTPLLGICLGMQLLATEGDEGGVGAGLGLVSGRVTSLAAMGCELRVPHVGWNTVDVVAGDGLLRGIPSGADFYFVHGFAFAAIDPACVAGTTRYGVTFPSVIISSRVHGAQFHPEKSSRAGLALLRNFLALPC
jgi:glutamine amidotransferase